MTIQVALFKATSPPARRASLSPAPESLVVPNLQVGDLITFQGNTAQNTDVNVNASSNAKLLYNHGEAGWGYSGNFHWRITVWEVIMTGDVTIYFNPSGTRKGAYIFTVWRSTKPVQWKVLSLTQWNHVVSSKSLAVPSGVLVVTGGNETWAYEYSWNYFISGPYASGINKIYHDMIFKAGITTPGTVTIAPNHNRGIDLWALPIMAKEIVLSSQFFMV